MNTVNAVVLSTPSSYQQNDHSSWRPSKRKFDSLLLHTKQEASGYPSPPMSTPPSPPGPPQELTSNTSSEPATSTAATTAGLSFPGLPPPLPALQFAPPPPPAAQTHYQPTFQSQIGGPTLPTVPGFYHASVVPATTSAVPTIPGTGGASTTKSGRKSRGHVASACINCKKAHLSCDVQRPCARCVSSGKQDTCIDVQHKKRGRPRLREEGEFSVEQMMPAPTPQPPTTFASSPTSTRPIAGTRHRRTESLRSLRSQTSDSSGASALPTPTYPPPLSTPPRFALQPPAFPSANLGNVDVPTAYLDLDLTFIRANNSFQQAMSGGRDVRGRRLDEIAGPADTNSFQSIRNQLREEREAREPSYMPPIIQQSQDALQGISDADADRITQGSTDRTYIWTPNQPSLSRERFTVRVRLARTNTYLVVVTLPPVRQTFTPAQPMPLASPFATPTIASAQTYQPPYGSSTTYSAPPSYYGIPGPAGVPSQQQASLGHPPPLSYGGYYPSQPQPYLPPPMPSRMPVTGPDTTAFTPPTARREPLPPPAQTAPYLPPIVTGSPAPSIPLSSGPPESRPRRPPSEDDGDDERSPKKRRRVGIHDVLQQ